MLELFEAHGVDIIQVCVRLVGTQILKGVFIGRLSHVCFSSLPYSLRYTLVLAIGCRTVP